MSKLDKKDYQILFELDKNSRCSIKELAKKSRLSRDIVAYRMKQLELKGIIQKYITIIDFSKLGYQITRLYLKLQNTTPEIEQQIINYFVELKNTLTVYKIDGKYDLAIGFLVKNNQEYHQIETQFQIKFKKYLADKNISLFLDCVHFHRNYLTNKKQRDDCSLSTGSFQPFRYDQKDLELLNLIKEDSRISLLELAKKMKMTPMGVKYKLKNLEKNKVVVAYKLWLNTSVLGYHYYKIDLDLEDLKVLPQLKQFIIQNPNVIYLDITIGGSDLEFDCELKNQTELYQLIDQLKQLAPNKIRNYSYYQAIKIYKYAYFPE